MKANREAEAKLSHEYLVSIFDYNVNTGIFIRKVSTSNCVRVGDSAGNLNTRGHLQIMVNNHLYHAHRLAWFYVYKEWPKGVIDHIDQNKQNNAIANLRDVDVSTNNHNRGTRKDNKSGVKGVSYRESQRRWLATICVRGKVLHLGSFIDKEFAIKARKEAELKYDIGV